MVGVDGIEEKGRGRLKKVSDNEEIEQQTSLRTTCASITHLNPLILLVSFPFS